jgi:hypothetical protein
MASIALVRVSGSVLSVPPARDYTFPAGSPRAGEKLTFETANLLVADSNVTAISLPRRDNTGLFEGLDTREIKKGDIVDFLCEVTIYKSDLQLRVLGEFPVEDPAYAPKYEILTSAA